MYIIKDAIEFGTTFIADTIVFMESGDWLYAYSSAVMTALNNRKCEY